MPAVADFFRVKLFINGEVGGWSEKYDFNTTDTATIRAFMNDLCDVRTPLLARNHTIRRCVASRMKIIRDSVTPFTFLRVGRNLAAEVSVPGLCNNSSAGLLYRFDSGSGKWYNRLIRGIRDDWVVGNGLNSAASLSTAGFVNAPFVPGSVPVAAGVTYVAALLAYLRWVGLNTKIMVPGTYQIQPLPAAMEDGFDPKDITRIQFVKVGNHDTGKGYQISRGRKKARI